MFFVVLDVIYAIGLLTAPRPLAPFYGWMNEVMPLGLWAACWAAVGLTCLWYAFRSYDTPAFMAAVALKVGWGLLSLFGWAVGGVSRGYVSAIIWLAFAAFVFLIAGGIPVTGPRPARRWRAWTR
ncbi:hypothetical protein OWR29_25605 [Actinoplanes sp. Pm04-4]|uniref:Uncharacterized protein n=1 Tax=Paractinoplanes pyxinae TaxID=2997416 RepID=A0ABT4B4H5_9ACTN|nr:hypothetical protein [Actinoplanes pyxinae]MCY1141389.1 hypothetical protein [Actinoplanes pyxinae]